ncbi:glycosyltransferase family 4 protein [Candidatus Calescamantes bacterium]|nr:glycosyltransferase family 4 protein [Candidatus Calescamantes bacterium]
MARIRVLHIITRLIIGGAQENTVYTVRGLKEKGYEVYLYSGPPLGPEGSIIPRAKKMGVHPIIISSLRRNLHPVLDYASFLTLFSLIKSGGYHIVHTHSSKAGILGRWAAYLAGVPVIIHTIHGLPFFPYQHPFLNFLFVNCERITAPITDRLICVCDMMKKQALNAGVGKEKQYVTIYSGMELDYFLNPPSSEKLRKKLGIKEDELVVGKVGRLFPFKGHEYIIQIAPEIIKNFPNVKFLFVGEGILREKLEERVKEKGLKDKFIFTGLVPPEDIPLYISLMDVVVHTSLREGLARVLPQGLAAGKPVVTWKVDGAEEVVKNGQTGFLITPGDLDGLKLSILKLLGNAELRKRMGEKGKKVVDPLFRVEEMVERIHHLYQEVLKEKGVKV